jgi:vitamin K-dependent gamma-carboxylase
MDGAGLRLFRWGFGLLAAASALRFVAKGWVAELYLDPAFHFAWFDWATVPTAPVLYGLFAAQVIGGLGTAYFERYRPWLVMWLVCFVYVELLDKALYLNHYVLMSVLGIGLLIARSEETGTLLRGMFGCCAARSHWSICGLACARSTVTGCFVPSL